MVLRPGVWVAVTCQRAFKTYVNSKLHQQKTNSVSGIPNAHRLEVNRVLNSARYQLKNYIPFNMWVLGWWSGLLTVFDPRRILAQHSLDVCGLNVDKLCLTVPLILNKMVSRNLIFGRIELPRQRLCVRRCRFVFIKCVGYGLRQPYVVRKAFCGGQLPVHSFDLYGVRLTICEFYPHAWRSVLLGLFEMEKVQNEAGSIGRAEPFGIFDLTDERGVDVSCVQDYIRARCFWSYRF